MTKQTREETRAKSISVGELLDLLDRVELEYRQMANDPILNGASHLGHADGIEHAGQIARTLAGGI